MEISCIAALIVLLVLAAKAPLDLFLLTGTVPGKNGYLVELVKGFYGNSPEILSSCTVQYNQFRISCPVEEEGPVTLVLRYGQSTACYEFFLKKGHCNFIL